MKISNHAMERYAERIMKRGSKTEVATFVNEHTQKINDDIEKMVCYGELMYSGKSLKTPGRKSEIYLNDLWAVIYDPDSDTVITLYKIDLGVGDDFDHEYAERLRSEIEQAQLDYREEKKAAEQEAAELKKVADEADLQIKELKHQISLLEEVKQSYSQARVAKLSSIEIAEAKYRQVASALTNHNIF